MSELVSAVELSRLDLAIEALGGPEEFAKWWQSIKDHKSKMRLAYD